jgi:DinB superfamily
MKRTNWILPGLLCLACAGVTPAQTSPYIAAAQAAVPAPQAPTAPTDGTLSAPQERHALQILLQLLEQEVESAADAMPADKYRFAPTDGEFTGVRTFGEQVKHLAATNNIPAAAALGEEPPAGAGDEAGPETTRTKAQILAYLKDSFAHLGRAVDAIGDTTVPVKPSPISPLTARTVTRLALVDEALIHSFDHYGQMVEYLRMNGVVPPASRP